MTRKPRKGYFVRGQFVAAGSEMDDQLQRELRGDGPSKTELKVQSAELQALGEQLLTLRSGLLDALDLPDRLLESLAELRRIADFEGRRRQSQYLGKLMRQLPEDATAAIRTALDEQRRGAARDTLRLHAAEQWRERLIADDAALGTWLAEFADTDVQQLRTLVRQARKDAPEATPAPGETPRHSRAFRTLFQWLQSELVRAETVQTKNATDTDESHAG